MIAKSGRSFDKSGCKPRQDVLGVPAGRNHTIRIIRWDEASWKAFVREDPWSLRATALIRNGGLG